MNASLSESSPPGGDSPDNEEAPSTEFAGALESFEHDSPAAAQPAARSALPVGTAVHGKVVSVTDDAVMVDYGGRSEGVADAVDLFVVAAGDEVRLAPSMKAESSGEALKLVREAHASGMPVTGKVTGVNSGGLAVDVGGVRGFCPLSQIELGFCSDPARYVGRSLEFTVTSIEENRGSAVLSRRKLLKQAEDESARQLAATLQVGDEREGTVRRLEPFGAFVDIGGADGLVHVSEIRHARVGHPKQVLKEGQKVKVKVLRIDASKEGAPRISLSMKAAEPDPWSDVANRFTVGATVQGTVARLTDFGAFVTLAPGIDGLVHVSEIAHERVQHPKDVLKPGQTVDAIVQSIDPEKKRVSLSIKKTLPRDESLGPARPPRSAGGGGGRGERRGGGGGGGSPRSPRESRERDSRPVAMPAAPAQPAEPTTMAIALRKAIEEAKKREQGEA
jgi:small subunit ribosomal protein S1